MKREFNHGLAGELERFQREVTPDLSRYADYREDDPGVAGRWYLDGTDDGDWDTMFVPQEWSTTPLARVDGTVWFRYGFELPPLGDGCRATLSLGCVDDDDVTWINSTEVGRTAGYAVERFYDIPPGVLRPGRNTITVKVTDNSGGGGLTSAPEDLYIRITGGEEVTVPLAGEWKYRTGIIDDAFRATMLHPHSLHSLLYGGMISPLTGLDITGIIWYQGESNVDNPAAYRTLFRALIIDWRIRWGKMLPFYWVQLANYMGRKDVPAESAWAELRQAQDMALLQPFTGQAVAIDIGEADNIHPANKQEVGRRLALYALRDVYGHDVVASGPRFIGIAGDGQPDGGAEVAASVDGRPGNRRAGNASVGSRQDNETAGTALRDGRSGENTSKARVSRRNRSRRAGARAEATRRDNTHADDIRTDDIRTDNVPQYQAPGAVTVLFRTYGLALTVPDGSGVVTGFELAGADGVYRRAEARITGGETVEVRSGDVPRPAAIRYGWADNPEVNLYNTEGLPAAPFEALIPVACE
ncbi:MAG: hypothetical protein LUE26_08990 [Alistipes sp.]|nr:hypothetical protein [Alistipes sp.]